MVLTTCAAPEPTHNVQVNVQGPTRIRYQKQGGSDWTDLGLSRSGSNSLNLPAVNVTMELSNESTFSASVSRRLVSPGDTILQIQPDDFHNEPNWPRIGGLLIAGLTALGAIARLLMKGTISRTGTNQEPLIRPDGKVPKRRVGNYRLTGILGTGGMGVVYQGEDDEGHKVAVKVPAPHLVCQNDFHQRFLREIKLGLDLRHHRVVKVLEMPVDQDLYVIMEYVQGTPLDKVPLQPWSIEWKRCLEWAAQTLEALVYIHSQGVIHRDLKPSNLMVLTDNSIKLMDFGIAHKVHGTRLTGTDSIMGTPVYMAPEQLQGAEIDPRADLFSLGLILYERLKPGLPYSDDLIETLRQKLSQPMIPLRETNPNFPSAFDEFIMTLLALQPTERYADASTALAALKPLLTLTKR